MIETGALQAAAPPTPFDSTGMPRMVAYNNGAVEVTNTVVQTDVLTKLCTPNTQTLIGGTGFLFLANTFAVGKIYTFKTWGYLTCSGVAASPIWAMFFNAANPLTSETNNLSVTTTRKPFNYEVSFYFETLGVAAQMHISSIVPNGNANTSAAQIRGVEQATFFVIDTTINQTVFIKNYWSAAVSPTNKIYTAGASVTITD